MALVVPHRWEIEPSDLRHENAPATHEIGPTALAAIPYPLINRVAQVRKTFSTEGMDELKRAMRLTTAQNDDNIELLHQLTVVELDEGQCERYLRLLNRLWGSNHAVEELVPNDRGMFYVLISGERRDRAVGEIIEEEGWDPWGVRVAANVRHDLSLFEAVLLQQAENTHERPPAQEEAASIQLLYELAIDEGEVTSMADYIKVSPYKEGKVRDAFRYFELPSIVHDMVSSRSFPYSRALLYVPLVRTYRRYTIEPEEMIAVRLERYILEDISARFGPDTISVKVQEHIATIIQQHTKEAEGEQTLFCDTGWEAQLAAERAQIQRLRFGLAVRPLRDLSTFVRLETQAARGERSRPILTHPEMQTHLANLRKALEELAAVSGIELARGAADTAQIIEQLELSAGKQGNIPAARKIGALSMVVTPED